MYATEFQTVIKDSYIKIPNFEHFRNKEVRIIILDIKPSSTVENNEVEDFIDYLIKNPVDMPKNTKFLSREEANER